MAPGPGATDMASSRGLAANLVFGVSTNLVRVGLQLVMLPVMARLLGPRELGLYALAMPMINFVLLLSDAGVGDSLAREKAQDRLVWSSAFWGLVGTGVVAMAAVNGAAWLVADAARQPRLPGLILPLSLTLLLVALTTIPQARMVRVGNTVPGAVTDMVAHMLGAATAIAAALYGFGVWALVAQYLTTYVIRAIGYNLAQPFLPGLQFRASSLLSHTGMGSQVLANRLMDLGASMFERSRVSLKLGAAAVGGYAYANQIGIFASNTVGSPMWANLYYVALNKTPNEVSDAFVRSHRLFALLIFPCAALLAVDMPTLVPLLLGPRWGGSVGPIMVMVLTAPFGNLATLHTAIFYARGLGRRVLLGLSIVVVLRMVTALVGWRYGVFGLCLGLGVISIGYYLATTAVASRVVGCSTALLFSVVAAPLLASIAAGALLHALQAGTASIGWLVASNLLAFACYAGLLLLFDRKHVQTDAQAAMAMVLRRPVADPA